ncbi:putative serpin-Z8 [Triticum dicoccoides]|uniref:putative serpin-Z8 n=1 Tax=Triticum dicoccoides TaxID=85692 RepID=UPI00188DE262|nr:putative serpin-Z8 [Triticum dicoccoides]
MDPATTMTRPRKKSRQSGGSGRVGQPKQRDALKEQRLPARGYELPVTKKPSVQFDVVGPTGNPVSSGLAALAVGLARRLADGGVDANLVFSPLSIYTALALLAAGARDATLDEILRALGARSRSELESFVSHMAADALQDRSAAGGPRIAFACGIWSDLTRRLKLSFREAVVGTYKAEASSVDFRGAPEAARSQINGWAAQVTRNLIDSVLPAGSISPATQVVLGNAMYFKGKWQDQPFDKRYTAHKPFHRLDHSQVDVPFMQSWKSQFVAVHDGFKVLKLRYKMTAPNYQEQAHSPPFGHVDSADHQEEQVPSNSYHSGHTQLSMCIFLPDAHDGLLGLVDTIASRPGFLQDHLPEVQITLSEFRVPKFKLSFQSSVVAVLKKLGLQLPFCLEGDLSDMVEDDGSGSPIVVEDVIHKAVVEVNEEGTEAAAVTVVKKTPRCAPRGRRPPPPQVDFIADHPFAYYIVEQATGAVVFAGHVVDPSKE